MCQVHQVWCPLLDLNKVWTIMFLWSSHTCWSLLVCNNEGSILFFIIHRWNYILVFNQKHMMVWGGGWKQKTAVTILKYISVTVGLGKLRSLNWITYISQKDKIPLIRLSWNYKFLKAALKALHLDLTECLVLTLYLAKSFNKDILGVLMHFMVLSTLRGSVIRFLWILF